MRRTISPSSVILLNSMIQTMHEKNPTNDTLLLLINSTSKLVRLALDPSDNFNILQNSIDMITQSCGLNVILLMLADVLQNTSANSIFGLLELFESLIVSEKSGNHLINLMILDGLIQVLACSTRHSELVDKIIEMIQSKKHETEQITDPGKLSLYSTEFCPEIANAVDLAVFIERENFSITPIKTSSDRYFWKQNQLLLRGLFHSEILDFESWKIVFNNLIEISKEDEILKTSLVMPLLFKLAHSTYPKIKLLILRRMIDLGKMTEIFGTIKALSYGLIRSMAIDLNLRLWRVEPRAYPLLYKVLVEPSPTDPDDFGLEIVRAAAVSEICDRRPQHGSDLVSLISEIINSSMDSKEGEIPTSLAIDSIISLCQNHVINIMSAWKAISKPMMSEKRPKVIKSLSNFFAIVPQFKRSNMDYENFSKDILAILWHMIENGSKLEIECALASLKNWKYDQMTLDTIPPIYREGIAMPEAPAGMEVSILDLEVLGECYVQLLTKINPDARSAVSDLIIHYIGCEILEFRSGHYFVKEGHAEPQNYKNLPKQSILKAITTFVQHQATTQKAEKRFEEDIVVEALKILAHKYSRQLPPLNWYFLQEFVTQSDKMREECFKILAKQSLISGTAKTLIENFLTSLDRDNARDVEIALNILVDCCNGVSTSILKTFCDFIFKVKNESYVNIITKFMQFEKDVSVKENFVIVLSSFLTHYQCTNELARSIPPKYFDSISNKFTLDQNLQYKMEILRSNANVENQISWMNEIINEQLMTLDHRNIFKKNLYLLFTASDIFPKKRFILDFIIMTQNRMVEDDFESEKLHFLLEIFIISIVSFSGYFCLCHQFDFERIFPQSLELISRQVDYDDSIGTIFEFLIHIASSDKVDDNLRKIFKNSLKFCKNHQYFKKSKLYDKCLDLLSN